MAPAAGALLDPTAGADAPASNASAALDYARRGWSVVPMHAPLDGRCDCRSPACPAAGKHPHIRWERAISGPAGPDEIEAWWRRWPRANVGVVTGRASGLVVLDVDPRHGGDAALARLREEHGPLPDTVESATGGGGSHLWFRAGDDVPASRVIAPGLELKGEGGLVVAPPSLHVSGRRYAWRPGHGPGDRPLEWWPADLIGGWNPAAGRRPHDPPIPRTDAERRAFAATWLRAGISIASGDAYYCCPFHPDEHPSLHVDADGCRWYCFGCRRGGGIGALRDLLGEPGVPMSRPRRRGTVGPAGAVTLPGERWIGIVGESHYQDELLALAGRRAYGGVDLEAVAELVPVPDHPLDPDAVSVQIGDRHVGYLARADARRLRSTVIQVRRHAGRATCHARIRGGWDRGRGNLGQFGVTVLVPVGNPAESLCRQSL